jgi:hypothetical protein
MNLKILAVFALFLRISAENATYPSANTTTNFIASIGDNIRKFLFSKSHKLLGFSTTSMHQWNCVKAVIALVELFLESKVIRL